MLYFIFKYSNSFWIILHLIIIILLFLALYSFDIYIRIISPVLDFPTLEENPTIVREGKLVFV